MLFSAMHNRGGALPPTPPDAVGPVLLEFDETGASVLVGSWSESVTVTVEGVDQNGDPAPVATVSGSGAGPYTLEVASGLESGMVYGYTLTGLASSGSSVITVALSVGIAPLTAPINPAQGPPEPSGTATVTRTWTHPGAPASGITYTLRVRDVATGTAITPVSGSGLGPYVIPVSDGLGAMALLEVTRTLDGQTAAPTVPHWIEITESPALSWAAPAAAVVASGVTSATITWATPLGGAGGYNYSDPGIAYDSAGASSTVTLSTSGSGAGATVVSGMVNGQTVLLQRTVTDSDGTVVSVQGAATVAATATAITAGTAPAGQSLAAGTTSATIGTWGAPSGGTAPYTYVVTELGGSGVTISGSGLGPYTVAGLTDGVTYAFLLTISDSAGVPLRGISVVTISVARSAAANEWGVVDELDFTDANWTALSSTDATASTAAWQHTLYASDGTTPRAYVRNNSTQARTLSLSPGGNGLVLVNGTTTATPSVAVWPAGWNTLRAASRRDAWLIEAIIQGEEPSGSGTFVHVFGISTSSTNASPLTGASARNTGSNTSLRAASYISSFAETTVSTITAGATRLYTAACQVTIKDSRRHTVYITPNVTNFQEPETGLRVHAQTASTTISAVNADTPASAAWFDGTIGGRTAFVLFHDGVATSGSAVRLLKLRLLRKVNGSI
jgi:hypothetical protein